MKNKDKKPSRSQTKKKTYVGRTGRTKKRARVLVQREYLFNATPVLITPPRHLYSGPVLRGTLTGSWKVAATSMSELAVTSMDAQLYMPVILIPQVEGKKPVAIGPHPIPLKRAMFKLPPYLHRQFGELNTGTFDRKSRFVSTTVGFRAMHKIIGPTRGVFQTFGFVNEQGLLISGGTALLLSGLFRGTILCCCSPRPPKPTPPSTPPPPPTCEGRVVVRDSGPTYDGNNHTDFQKYGLPDGTVITLTPAGPTAPNQLGFVQGSYPGLPPGNRDQGRFKKIEIEVTADAPCRIVSVTRAMTRLPGHGLDPAHAPNAPDGPAQHSIAVQTEQRWVITDAPGILTAAPANKTFHKRYDVTATIQQGTNTFTRTATYIVLIRTDASGNIIANPTPP